MKRITQVAHCCGWSYKRWRFENREFAITDQECCKCAKLLVWWELVKRSPAAAPAPVPVAAPMTEPQPQLSALEVQWREFRSQMTVELPELQMSTVTGARVR